MSCGLLTLIKSHRCLPVHFRGWKPRAAVVPNPVVYWLNQEHTSSTLKWPSMGKRCGERWPMPLPISARGHLVALYETQTGIVLAKPAVPDKGNEISVEPA